MITVEPHGSNSVSAALASSGCEWKLVPFNREGWDGQFPTNKVVTPLGEFDISPERVETPDVGLSLIGLIRPILEAPSYIVSRAGTLSFHRAVLGPEGGVRGYATVALNGERVRVFVSEQPGDIGLLNPDASGVLVADDDGDGRATFKSWAVSRNGGEVTLAVTDFDLCVTLLGIGGDLFKADHGPIPADARWITVHPNGEGTKGQPVLVVPVKDGSGHMRVIGGAGGKLNMMKLRGVKSPSEYKAEFSARAAKKRQAQKEQARKDKELGIDKAKAEAREQINAQRRNAQKAFIATVAEAMGWGADALHIDTSALSPAAQKKAESRHHADLLAKARAAVDSQRQILVQDLDRRAAAGLGTVPLDAPLEDLSVQDLDPVRLPEGSGVSPEFKARAEAAGLSGEKLDSEVAKVKAQEGKAAADPVVALEKGMLAAAIRKEVESLPKPNLQTAIVDAKKAVALIKARKQLQAIEKAAREANAAVDGSTVEPKAFVLAVSDVDEAAVSKLVEDDLRTARAAAFLAGVDEAGGEDEVAGHLAAGAYNAVNALSQVVGGGALMDRSVVDVLGVAGAAQVLAARLYADLAGDASKVAAGLAEYHIAHAPELQKGALEEARELQEAAAQIEVENAAAPLDLAEAAALNRQRLEHLAAARKVLGQALGEMEARASMIAALEAGPRDHVEVSLGKVGLDSAIKQLWALGLSDADYSVERVEGNVFAKVNAAGMAKLAAPVDKENIERVERNLAIMRGEQDEDDWLPEGFAKRPDLGLDLKPGVAPSLAEPFDHGAADLAAALRAYIGSRTADGDKAADIVADVQSASFLQKVGKERAKEYLAALDAVIPTKNGKSLTRVEELAPIFDLYADEYVGNKYGGTRSTLNRQKFEPDAIAQEALHRALSDEPAGTLAYKPIGELTLSERGKLRDWFYANVAKESPEQKELRAAAEKLAAAEPEKFVTDMFGETSQNPAWSDWQAEYNEAAAKASNAGLDWNRYTKIMRGNVRALETVQDLIRSKVSEGFAKHHNTLRPHAALKVGTTVVRNNLGHLSATDPAEREKRLSMERALIDSLRARIKGKYASGSVADKIEATKAYEAAFGQAQMGFFASDDLFGGGDTGEKPLGGDERRTIGHAAEAMIGKMMGAVGGQFKPGEPVKLFNPSMSGKGVNRQRAIKLIGQNKRVILGAGVGSGKTAMMLGAFSDLHSKGEVKKGLFVVPSIVQGQFGSEALRFLEPGKFKWHAEPGASYEDRLAAYKDPETHFAVVTHQSFRDDVLRMAVDAGMGKSPAEVADKLGAMAAPEQHAFVKQVLDHHGVSFDFAAADEAHNLLDREGKENSRMSNVIGGVTAHAPFYVHASGDPVKNDASEAFSLLQKMDPARYSDRGAFMRRYGGDTKAAKDGLQRELARHLYTFSLTPDVEADKKEIGVPLSEAQKGALATMEKQAAALRIAKMTGGVDVEAAKAFAPHFFDGASEDQHEALARKVADSVGIMKQSAYRRIIDAHPASEKLSHVSKIAAERKGQPGVVFAHSLEAVESIRKRLEAEGHRVATITGKDSAADKDAKIRAFNPDKGDATADIIVASDAGATGANLQSGRWLVQYDTPNTAMGHAQRRGRIHRIGQKNNVELIDLVSEHESERRARRRLANKYDLRDLLTSPLDGLDDSGIAFHLKQAGIGAPPAQSSLF